MAASGVGVLACPPTTMVSGHKSGGWRLYRWVLAGTIPALFWYMRLLGFGKGNESTRNHGNRPPQPTCGQPK